MVRPIAFRAHLENTSTLKVAKYVEIVKLVIIAQVDMKMVQTPILPVVCFVSLENIKILRVKQVVFPAHQVGTKISPNKLIVLIVQLEELQPRSPVKLNAIYASQADIKKTLAVLLV